MADRSRGHKQMESPHSVIHTYYQGDINTVVDEHFFRALNKTSMPKDLSTKKREQQRTAKPDFPASASWSPSWSKSGASQSSSSQRHASADPAQTQGVIMGPMSADPWVYSGRRGSGYDLSPMYQQSAPPPNNSTSYLHLLNMEQSGGGVITPSNKTDLQLDWTVLNDHRDGRGGRTKLDSGMQLPDKTKDVYWY